MTVISYYARNDADWPKSDQSDRTVAEEDADFGLLFEPVKAREGMAQMCPNQR